MRRGILQKRGTIRVSWEFLRGLLFDGVSNFLRVFIRASESLDEDLARQLVKDRLTFHALNLLP